MLSAQSGAVHIQNQRFFMQEIVTSKTRRSQGKMTKAVTSIAASIIIAENGHHSKSEAAILVITSSLPFARLCAL